jgi:streptogramin lyase
VARIRVESTAIAFGAGSAWVVDHGERDTLLRIDPATHATVERVPLAAGGGSDFFELTYAANRVWVAAGRSGTIRTVAPATGAVTAPLHVGPLEGIAVGHGGLWVLDNHHRITEFSLDGERRWRVRLPTEPRSMAVTRRGLCVAYRQDSL